MHAKKLGFTRPGAVLGGHSGAALTHSGAVALWGAGRGGGGGAGAGAARRPWGGACGGGDSRALGGVGGNCGGEVDGGAGEGA